MPNRLKRVRVSVRERVESEDSDWHTTQASYQHKRWQVLDSLAPLSMDDVFRLGRKGFEADWEATANHKPVIEDGWWIVAFVDGSPELYLEVVKGSRRGRKQHILLRESPEIQS